MRERREDSGLVDVPCVCVVGGPNEVGPEGCGVERGGRGGAGAGVVRGASERGLERVWRKKTMVRGREFWVQTIRESIWESKHTRGCIRCTRGRKEREVVRC